MVSPPSFSDVLLPTPGYSTVGHNTFCSGAASLRVWVCRTQDSESVYRFGSLHLFPSMNLPLSLARTHQEPIDNGFIVSPAFCTV
jgi:hypothetical protein